MRKITFIIILFLISSPLYAEVSLLTDGGFELTISSKAHLGQEIDLPPLKIYPGDRDRVFEISKVNPSELKKGGEGYEDMPMEWLVIKTTEVVINANETCKILMALHIPDEQEFYGGDYHISLCIRLKPNPGEFFSLASYPRIRIHIAEFKNEIEKDNPSNNFIPDTPTPCRE